MFLHVGEELLVLLVISKKGGVGVGGIWGIKFFAAIFLLFQVLTHLLQSADIASLHPAIANFTMHLPLFNHLAFFHRTGLVCHLSLSSTICVLV